MYKVLFFLHKSDQKNSVDHFLNHTLKLISQVAGKDLKAAEVESNLLVDTKFNYCCIAEFDSKEDFDKKMNTADGKNLNKDLMDYHQLITAIQINYNTNS